MFHKKQGTPSEPLSTRRFLLWLGGLTLALSAGWVLLGAMHTRWALGILIGGGWLITILFNTFFIDYLLQHTTSRTQNSQEKPNEND